MAFRIPTPMLTALTLTITLAVASLLGSEPGVGQASDLAALAQQPLDESEAFRPVSQSALDVAAARLRSAIVPLQNLLTRSPSGANWKIYLDWPGLTLQAASAKNADLPTLKRLEQLLLSEENGLEMHQFVAVRRALSAYAEAVEAAKAPQAQALYKTRMQKLSAAVAAGATAGTTEALAAIGPLLAQLEQSGQAPVALAKVRSVVNQPNLYLDINESLLGSAVNRSIDQTAAVNDVILGTRICGSGHTTGLVLLDFVPAADRAIVDLNLDAINQSNTIGTRGRVTVRTHGVTKLDARKRIIISEQGVSALPVEAHASANTSTTGLSISKNCGKQIIQRIATKKIAEMRPQAEAAAEQAARKRLRSQFDEQTAGPIAKASADYQTKFRRPLLERGWYPEFLHINTSDSQLSIVARKALVDQIAAFTPPPAVDPDAVISSRVHETLVNNAAEIALGGRTIDQTDVEKMAREQNTTVHESLHSDPDQPPWSITFARLRPVELDADNGRIKLTVRGSKYTSGEREFPAMNIWVAYRIEPAGGNIRLVRDGDVQIYPPGFVPGGAEKLTISQTSLRRILQKRFGKVFKEVIDVEPLQLPGQLASAGPLPMEQFVAQKDGWLAVGWRQRDPVVAATLAAATPEVSLPIEPVLAQVQ